MSSRHRLPKRSGSAEPAEATEPGEVTESTAVDEAEASTEKSGESTEVTAEVTAESAGDAVDESSLIAKRKVNWARVFAYGVLPAVALLLATAAGYLKWVDDTARYSDLSEQSSPAAESLQAAKDTTVAMLSYKPDTVEQQLNEARNLLTGEFQESYTGLINDVVIPGAREKQISAVASVPAAASVSADPKKAVVLVFVNQTVVVGQDAPTDTASSVRVTLEKTGDRWLISKFDPV
ncbi:hypothetical protein [Mycobacterium deserti]|uniref:Outer membrane protein n=1 Tax=Mycobacterium deserti TaxID=2978347 RepID=A0ABT2M480_9MYCO|nr:hypothetical protein [Mycobacterium deserti]MCT7657068.1 hypothetical protein [Mycobacterium deserti]